MEEKKTRTTKKVDLLMAVENIVELAKKSQLQRSVFTCDACEAIVVDWDGW